MGLTLRKEGTGTRARRRRASTSFAAACASPGDRRVDAPMVLVRLVLLAVDALTGEERLAGSFLKRMPMPAELPRPGMPFALDIFGAPRLLQATDVRWDDEQRIQIVEVAWRIAEAARILGVESRPRHRMPKQDDFRSGSRPAHRGLPGPVHL